MDDLVRWEPACLEVYQFPRSYPKNERFWFHPGVAFSMIGSSFIARAHRYRSVFEVMGSSVFPTDIPQALCLMNSALARQVMESLNPSVHFQVGDVNRLPLFPIESADAIVARLDEAFTQHEQARETSVEFRRPGPSPWRTAQEWAQRAVDRAHGEPLPAHEPTLDPEPPLDHLSYALGVALGRFGAQGEGILEQAPDTALPNGILFLSAAGGPDSLEHPATHPLHETWQKYGKTIAPKTLELRDYLRTKFFPDDHLKRYEKRPIYFPLTSEKKSFVAWCSIHRWTDSTLQVLLADHLQPEAGRLKAELADLAEARTTGDRSTQARAQGRFTEVQALYEEMLTFIRAVQEIAEKGAPPAGPKCPPREADARFAMDLDDGVMINSAALWPLLQPQWKDPATWWTELCTAKGRKDYDWAHLAKRYFPSRVESKCQSDPSLAVAHGCFWKYHPEKAYQWELRLQAPDELGPDFRLDEPGSDAYRADLEARHASKVRELREAEEKRRARKADKAEEEGLELEFDEDEAEED
ncbi:class I SAM-dependent methyltransferase [bacterium CPR1]|nr:class I SAM-dependent methyltransferase [bacterium CPR1]